MIESQFAAEQIQRLSGLDFYPKEKPALKELRMALECAISDAIAIRVISDWLSYSTTCPKPSEIRRLCYEENERHNAHVSACRECSGSGFLTIWKLVTYVGRSYSIKRSEAIVGGYEEAMRLARVLAEPLAGADCQLVQSAARECSCRKRVVA